MNDWLLEWVAIYGPAVLFVILTAAQAGVPLPTTILLIITGSLAGQGDLDGWQVLLFATAGAAAGDIIGYFLGRFGGRRMAKRLAKNGSESMERAEAFSRRWGDMGVFFSRWLVTPLGPWLNLVSGAAGYPIRRFIFWVVVGEFLWVAACIAIGFAFSESVRYITDLMGSLVWVLFGLVIAAMLIWQIAGFVGSIQEEDRS